MIPDSATGDVIPLVRDKVTEAYLSGFTAEELSEIAAFLRTDAARKLRRDPRA